MSSNGQDKTKRVAILIEQQVEDAEFQVPYAALQKAGAEVVVLGTRMNESYKGKQGKLSIEADGTTTESLAAEFDAVIIPGGAAPDRMRTNAKTVHFVKSAIEQGILVAAVCHGPQVLIEADLLRGKQATGFDSIRKDMENAGAEFVDEPLVADGNLLTARRPGDLPIFTTAILQRLGLTVSDTTLPSVAEKDAGWWRLGEQWNGSSKSEIVDAINTAIAGERYGAEAFERYADRVSSDEVRHVFRGICTNKQHHLQLLEARLATLEESQSLQATASGAFAALKTLFQSNDTSDFDFLRRALGDLQTGVVDTYNLRNKLTDPATVAIFAQMEVTIARDEQHVVDLYHAIRASGQHQPPQPTSGTAVSA